MRDNIKLLLEDTKVKGHVAVQLFKNGKETLKTEVHNTFSSLPYSLYGYFWSVIDSYMRMCDKNNSYSMDNFSPQYMQLLNLVDTTISANKPFYAYSPLAWANLFATYSGSDTTQGSLNQVDSCVESVDANHVKFHIVVDFPTTAANGTFNAIKILNCGGGNFIDRLSGTRTIQRSPYTDKYTGTFAGFFVFYITNSRTDTNFSYDVNDDEKILEADNQTIKCIFVDSDSKCKLLKYNFAGAATPTILGEIKKSNGTDNLDISKNPFIEDDTNYIVLVQDDSNKQFKIVKINKTTLVADTDGTTFASTISYDTIKQNSLDFTIRSMGNNSQAGEFYISGYTHDTVYHNYLLILDKTGAVTKTISLGDSTSDFWDFNGISATKDYIYLGFNYCNEQSLVIDKASGTRYSDAIMYWSDGSFDCRDYKRQHALSQNADDIIRSTYLYNTEYPIRNQVHYPEGFLNMAKLDTPVTKTSDNTMKVTYDITAEIPFPVYTA